MDTNSKVKDGTHRFCALSLNVELAVWKEEEDEESEEDKISVFRELRGRNKNNCSHALWCLCHTAVSRGQSLAWPMVTGGGGGGGIPWHCPKGAAH